MDDPQIVLYIAADAPKNDILYGGTVIGPIIKNCLADILPYLEVEKTEDQLPKKYVWGDVNRITVEDFIGKSKKEVTQEGLLFEFSGEGDTVIDQLPEAGSVLDEGGKVWITLGDDQVGETIGDD